MLVYNFYQKHVSGLLSWSSEHRFNHWSVKISYAAGQLSPCTTGTEAHTPRACVPQERLPQREVCVPPQRAAPRLLQLETAQAQK